MDDVARVRGLLEPGATVIVSLPNVGHWSTYAHLARGTWPRKPEGIFDATHLRWFTLRDAEQLLSRPASHPAPSCGDAGCSTRGSRLDRLAPPLNALHVPVRDRGSLCSRAMPVTDLAKIFKAYDVRGIYGRDIDGDTAEAVGRGLARALAELSGKPADQLQVGLGPRHAALRAGARGPLPRRADGRGRARRGRRDGRHRDALLAGRLARPRRRPDVHRQPQPEGLHGREDRRARERRAVERPRAERDPRAHRERARRRPGRRQLRDRRHLRGLPARSDQGDRRGRHQAAEGRARRRQRHGRPDGRARSSRRCRSS